MSSGIFSDLPASRFDVIAADPPWKYQKNPGAKQVSNAEPWGRKSSQAERHYGTLTNEQIADLPVGDLAAPTAHLFMWVTNPGLYGGRFSTLTPAEIAAAWGFTYQTTLTWVKTASEGRIDRGGMGWYFRGATEHVLYCTRGRASIPAPLRQPNVFLAAKGRHSAKPPAFYRMVEEVVPLAERLELFARAPRAGWTTWGNEADGSRLLTSTEAAVLDDDALFPLATHRSTR